MWVEWVKGLLDHLDQLPCLEKCTQWGMVRQLTWACLKEWMVVSLA